MFPPETGRSRAPWSFHWPDDNVVAVIAPELRDAFIECSNELVAEMRTAERPAVALLVPWQEPPPDSRRHDGYVDSFLCSRSIFRQLFEGSANMDGAAMSFALMHGVLNRRVDAQTFRVRQVGRPSRPTLRQGAIDQRAAVIMAHRGPVPYLETALDFLDNFRSSPMLTIKVGLDVDSEDEYERVASHFRRHEFFGVDTDDPPAGPYVIRQGLIERSAEPLLLFHDSDDICSDDRYTVQFADMCRWNADLVGSHEIQVDEINQCVEAIRFPLDVTAALGKDARSADLHNEQEPLLHATALVRREAFLRAGGLSTDRRIANDTQFMLRAHFSMRMRNSDEFLYVRRKHAASLTVAPETAAGHPIRRALAAAWSSDFEAVKRGTRVLEETSLLPRASSVPCALRRMSTGALVARGTATA